MIRDGEIYQRGYQAATEVSEVRNVSAATEQKGMDLSRWLI